MVPLAPRGIISKTPDKERHLRRERRRLRNGRSISFTSPVTQALVCRSTKIPTHMRRVTCPRDTVIVCLPFAWWRSTGFFGSAALAAAARSQQHSALGAATNSSSSRGSSQETNSGSGSSEALGTPSGAMTSKMCSEPNRSASRER